MNQEEEESAEVQPAPTPKKAVKRVAKEKTKSKEAKKPDVFKENKWNPNIELVLVNQTMSGKDNEVDQSCSVISSNREVI